MSRKKLEGSVDGQVRAPGAEPERSEGEAQGARRRAPGGRPQRLWAPRKAEAVVRVMGGEDPACRGPMRVLAAIHPPAATRAILDCLGLPSRAPPVSPPEFDSTNDSARTF